MTDNLPELKDIHIPDGVSVFPPAIGWYFVLLAIIILILLYHAIKHFLRHSRSRYALSIINNTSTSNPVFFATKCSEVLRRVCVYKFKYAVNLKGKEWQQFLRINCTYNLNEDSFSLLADAPYLNENNHKYSVKNAEQIKLFCQKFIGENL